LREGSGGRVSCVSLDLLVPSDRKIME
jgi:hypothetical protein